MVLHSAKRRGHSTLRVSLRFGHTRISKIKTRKQENLLVLSCLMLLLLTKDREKFWPYTETTEKTIPFVKRYNTLFTISFYPALAFMALVLSTCSAVSPELLHQHSVNSLMQVRCPISLRL